MSRRTVLQLIAGLWGETGKTGRMQRKVVNDMGLIAKRADKRALAFRVVAGMAVALLLVAFSSTLPSQAIAATGSEQQGALQAAEPVKQVVKWKIKNDKAFCFVDGVKQTGFKTIEGKSYYFDKNGVQRTGWYKLGSAYRFFNIKCGAKGFMATSKVVNGIKLAADGKAKTGSVGQAELKLMCDANKVLQSVSTPGQSLDERLRAVWRWMQTECYERGTRPFHASSGWHRTFASDIFNTHSGSCESYGAAYAYLANAAGAKSCKAICSGGHGWAEVNGKVYDVEWTGHSGYRYFAFPYSMSGVGGAPMYRGNCVYVVTLSPNTKSWGSSGSSGSASAKRGLVKSGSARYFYKDDGTKLKNAWKTVNGKRYYFGSKGKAVTGSSKVKGKAYVFGSDGVLKTGKSTRVVTVAGVKYRVAKNGRAKSGLDSSKAKLYLANGELACAPCMYKGKLFWCSAAGIYDSAKTSTLRAAAAKDADGSALVGLLGSPNSTHRAVSCAFHNDEEGDDVIYTYKYLKVYTFVVTQKNAPDEGAEYVVSVL